MAKRILIAQVLVVATFLIWLFYKELPGAIREIRMWRMAKRG